MNIVYITLSLHSEGLHYCMNIGLHMSVSRCYFPARNVGNSNAFSDSGTIRVDGFDASPGSRQRLETRRAVVDALVEEAFEFSSASEEHGKLSVGSEVIGAAKGHRGSCRCSLASKYQSQRLVASCIQPCNISTSTTFVRFLIFGWFRPAHFVILER